MEPNIEKYKGIHPGMVLERELKKRKLKKARLHCRYRNTPKL